MLMKYVRCSLLTLLSLLLLLPSVSRAEQAAPDGALPCTYTVPDEVQSYSSYLNDGDPYTTVTLKRKETLRMQIDGGAPLGLFFDFFDLTGTFTLTFYDAEGNRLSEQKFADVIYHFMLPVSHENVSAVELTVVSGEVRIAECFAYSEGFVPPFSDADPTEVLVILNEPGDELYLFGGLLAKLAGEHGLSVQVVYLTQTDAWHAHQCMDILRAMGVRRAPQFGSARKDTSRNEQSVYKTLGGDALVNKLTGLIRTHRPKLLLTLDPSEEQERFSDSVIARSVLTAVEYANDAKRIPDSDPYAVPKVYTLSAEGETVIPLNVPLYAYDGITVDALAAQLMQLYVFERN